MEYRRPLGELLRSIPRSLRGTVSGISSFFGLCLTSKYRPEFGVSRRTLLTSCSRLTDGEESRLGDSDHEPQRIDCPGVLDSSLGETTCGVLANA